MNKQSKLYFVDKKDEQILDIISQNPKTTQKEISDKIKLSQPSVSTRLIKLEQFGILHYQAIVDLDRLSKFKLKD